MTMQSVTRLQPKITRCDRCEKALPPEIVAMLQRSPQFYTCPECAAKGHIVLACK
jgi:hypothetical protein